MGDIVHFVWDRLLFYREKNTIRTTNSLYYYWQPIHQRTNTGKYEWNCSCDPSQQKNLRKNVGYDYNKHGENWMCSVGFLACMQNIRENLTNRQKRKKIVTLHYGNIVMDVTVHFFHFLEHWLNTLCECLWWHILLSIDDTYKWTGT